MEQLLENLNFLLIIADNQVLNALLLQISMKFSKVNSCN